MSAWPLCVLKTAAVACDSQVPGTPSDAEKILLPRKQPPSNTRKRPPHSGFVQISITLKTPYQAMGDRPYLSPYSALSVRTYHSSNEAKESLTARPPSVRVTKR